MKTLTLILLLAASTAQAAEPVGRLQNNLPNPTGAILVSLVVGVSALAGYKVHADLAHTPLTLTLHF